MNAFGDLQIWRHKEMNSSSCTSQVARGLGKINMVEMVEATPETYLVRANNGLNRQMIIDIAVRVNRSYTGRARDSRKTGARREKSRWPLMGQARFSIGAGVAKKSVPTFVHRVWVFRPGIVHLLDVHRRGSIEERFLGDSGRNGCGRSRGC